MLEIRPNCECCGKLLSVDSTEVMICSFECTYCSTCVDTILHNVCPNCGGGFQKRPVRPKAMRIKYPAKTKGVAPPINETKHQAYLKQYLSIPPDQR